MTLSTQEKVGVRERLYKTSASTESESDPDEASASPVELGLDDALKIAIELHQNRQYEGAEELYRRILGIVPEHPDALHFLGMLQHQRGASDEGIALIEQAARRAPGFAGFHNNLGNIHASRGDVPAATAAYEHALALAPESADLHNNLGALYRADDRFADARAAYQRAIALDPEHLTSHNNLGLLHAAEGDLQGAVGYYCKALELMPGHPDGRKLLGMTYYTMGKIKEAAEVFRQWRADAPEHPVANHMYAASSGEGVPERAPDNYVEYTFDRFADSFETQLNDRLHYQAPQLCAAMLARHLPAPVKQFVILDAGCGTGLCGPLVKQWACALAGVDLSRGMLDHARTKGVYTDLYKAELTEFLRESPGQWDVLLSADTLCYFGDLHAVMAAAGVAARASATLVLTVEALAESSPLPFHLEPHGRYAHSQAHVREALAAGGFEVIEITQETLRQEGGKPVRGWLVAARRTAG